MNNGVMNTGRPNLTVSQAEELARDSFDFDGCATPLPSYEDQNFRIESSEGRCAVLKIFNVGQDTARLDCQAEVMRKLNAAGVSVPSVIGRGTVRSEGHCHQVRLVSWLQGSPLGFANPITPSMARACGALLGRMDTVLADFQHEGANIHFDWDLANAETTIRQHMDGLDAGERALVDRVLELYRSSALRVWNRLPRAVIHNDANEFNFMVGPATNAERVVSGLLDFGDVVHTARVCNAAICAAYLAPFRRDPVDALCDVVRGYHSEFALSEIELEAFFALACTRLALSVCMSTAKHALEPENDYIIASAAGAWACLRKFSAIHPRLAHYRIREAAGFEAVPGSRAIGEWIAQHRSQFSAAILPARAGTPPVVFDFSVGSLEFDPEAIAVPGVADKQIWDRAGDAVGIGRWDEARLVYAGDAYVMASGERRTIHLGVDLFRPTGTPVHAVAAGTIHSFCAHHERFDYGGCIVLEHRPGDGILFWTLYGHLSHDSVSDLEIGRAVEAGSVIARLGSFEENGGWVPHLHFQIITDMLDMEGTFPGVAAPTERSVWKSLSLSPKDILGLGVAANAAEPPRTDDLLRRRKRSLGSVLSLSYRRPLHIVRGLMQNLYDAEGRAFLDAVNNVPHVGHSNPRVVSALHKQMRTLTTNTLYLHENILQYAERLSATLPARLEVCFFVNSGSEANDLALRMARAYTAKADTVVLDGAYHGNLTSLIGISPYKFDGTGGEGKPDTTHVARMPDSYRGDYRGMSADSGHAYARDIKKAAQRGTVAAFIAETLPGCGGQIVPPPGYFEKAARYIRASGGVFIADEVQVGLGRVGRHFWGFELASVVPDIVVLGKPIGNGHPLGAVITTREIADAFDNGMEYFNTFGGNPASCAVGLAVLDEIESRSLQQNALETGERLLSGLEGLAATHPIMGDVRGEGLFIGVELVRNREDLEPADLEAEYIVNRMRESGILISRDGPLHNVLKIKPPLVFTAGDADLLLETLNRVLSEDFVRARLA